MSEPDSTIKPDALNLRFIERSDFGTTLREISRKVALAAEAYGEDHTERTYQAVLKMLRAHPGIGAIYNVSGGNAGLVRALIELEREQDVIVIAHEIASGIRAAPREGKYETFSCRRIRWSF